MDLYYGQRQIYRAMMYARKAHQNQVRKYTNNPYFEHLAEVAALVAAVDVDPDSVSVAWLHDVLEDQPVTVDDLAHEFGEDVSDAVLWLSDLEQGNRATRKAAARARLKDAPGWIQTIKVADLISNTASIVTHDPNFAKVYLKEKKELLEVLTLADPRLLVIAEEQIGG